MPRVPQLARQKDNSPPSFWDSLSCSLGQHCSLYRFLSTSMVMLHWNYRPWDAESANRDYWIGPNRAVYRAGPMGMTSLAATHRTDCKMLRYRHHLGKRDDEIDIYEALHAFCSFIPSSPPLSCSPWVHIVIWAAQDLSYDRTDIFSYHNI